MRPSRFFSRDELLGQGAARPLREHRDLGAQFVARREIVLGLAVFVAALVFGDHAGDRVALIDQLGAGELREDVDAGLLDKSAEPLHQLI